MEKIIPLIRIAKIKADKKRSVKVILKDINPQYLMSKSKCQT
jgi:hypothetical protein